ncbi:MAG TPA: MBL fold metallo-hydrolase [Steroidobacter sp.]|uniref:MBL fold metallo-hydrolase n=1 Tax=Steroidobacter sp. TaxID=1978227 RepID=UPI002ED9A3D5
MSICIRQVLVVGLAAWLGGALSATSQAGDLAELRDKVWIHGAEDCETNRDPPLEVFRFDADTYVLRQSKCVNWEAPFMYVLFGQHTVFVQDTGATEDAAVFPVYETIRKLIQERGNPQLKMLVTHSHSHGDHIAGDAQFRGKPGVTLVEPNNEAVRKFFGFTKWPQGAATVDLGGRVLTVLPAPGHQTEALAVFDSRTGWLLTGDSVLPGRLYVWDWPTFKASVRRMVEFSRTNPVTAVMGTHIELSRTGEQFPAGTPFQPNEASLVLTPEDLVQLDRLLQKAGDEPKEIVTDSYVVSPVGMLKRAISAIIKALTPD